MSVFRTPRRRATTVGVAVAGFAVLSAPAWAYYLVTVSGTPSGTAVTSALGAGATPTVQPDATVSLQLDLSWTASSLSSVTPTVNATGYEVLRYSAASGGTGTHVCGTTTTSFVATTSCNDLTTSATTWYYTVIPHYQSWSGAESATRGSGTSAVISTGPSAPTSVTLVNGKGTNNAFVSNQNKTSVSFDVALGSGSKATDTVHLTIDDGTTTVTAATQAGTLGAGTLHFTGLNLTTLNDGTLNVKAWATSALGTSSNATLSVTKDTAAPGAPTGLALVNGGGSSANYINIANAGALSISASPAEVSGNDTLSASLSDGTHTTGSTSAAASTATVTLPNLNTATTTPSGGLSDGSANITLTVTETDAAGNASSATLSLNKDTIRPSVPTVTGGSNGYVDPTNGNADSIKGSTENGAIVTITESTPQNGKTYSAAANLSNGNFQINVDNISSGNYSYSVTATDAAGNISTAATVSGADAH